MLLTSLTEEFEVPVAMAVIHFSQSFYNQFDSQRLYEFVAFHTIWNALEHWEEIINSAIQEEIKAHKEHSSSFIHDIAVSNLLQFRKIMKNISGRGLIRLPGSSRPLLMVALSGTLW